MELRLDDRTALVTGGSRGIGRRLQGLPRWPELPDVRVLGDAVEVVEDERGIEPLREHEDPRCLPVQPMHDEDPIP